ncbi:MAG: ADP-ribosylglycohydrolase family protein [Clostridia bacterium]|nr:ADP-ribosylglycohydrolase family protein [Clostridia bacterium]
MIGAIIGDIAGSRFEWNNHRDKDFLIFHKDCFLTDDSYMTIAVAKAVKDCCGNYGNLSHMATHWMQEVGQRYPHCGFGGSFWDWVFDDDEPKPYGSFGNGAAMRVSAAGFYGKTLEEVKDIAYKVTCVSHDHPEGIKGAEATAVCIYLARTGSGKEYIRKYVEDNYYKLDFTIDGIRPTYKFSEICQDTVPQAIEAFLESESFEDCVKLAISLGGDSDTIAAIACAVAEAFYGVPAAMKRQAEGYMDSYILALFEDAEITK